MAATKSYNWHPAFLAALRVYPVIRYAAEIAGVDRATVWRARQADEEFDQQVKEAIQDGVDRVEQAAFESATVGVAEPVIYQGRLQFETEVYRDDNGVEQVRVRRDNEGNPVPLVVRKVSTPMQMFLLKGQRKEVYAERTELTGAAGGPLQVDETTRAFRVAQLVELARRRARDAQQDDEFDLA